MSAKQKSRSERGPGLGISQQRETRPLGLSSPRSLVLHFDSFEKLLLFEISNPGWRSRCANSSGISRAR